LVGPEGQLEFISICKHLFNNPDAAHVNVQLGRARCIHSSSMEDNKERNQPVAALTLQHSKSDNKMQIDGSLVGYAMMMMYFESWKNMSCS
jgi:hypothetical protein